MVCLNGPLRNLIVCVSRETMNLGTSMTARSRRSRKPACSSLRLFTSRRWQNISPLFGSFFDFLDLRSLAAFRTFRSEFSNRTAGYRFSQNLDIVHEDKAICLTCSRPRVFFQPGLNESCSACLRAKLQGKPTKSSSRSVRKGAASFSSLPRPAPKRVASNGCSSAKSKRNEL